MLFLFSVAIFVRDYFDSAFRSPKHHGLLGFQDEDNGSGSNISKTVKMAGHRNEHFSKLLAFLDQGI